MQLYIDTANLNEIQQAADMGVLDGVTTNPSLVAREGNIDYRRHMEKICRLVSGPVSAEVVATDTDGMLREAADLVTIAENIVIKLPTTEDGVRACKTLADRGVKTNLTLCFQALQAMIVAKAGAFLVSPFLGRIDDIAGDGVELIQQIRAIYDNFGFKTKILSASIRSPKHLVDVAIAGSDVATVPYKVIKQMLNHPLTDSGLAQFLADHAKSQKAAEKAMA